MHDLRTPSYEVEKWHTTEENEMIKSTDIKRHKDKRRLQSKWHKHFRIKSRKLIDG